MNQLKKDNTFFVLYSEFMPYNMAAFNQLASLTGEKIHVVFWDTQKLSAYHPDFNSNLILIRRSETGYSKLRRLLNEVDPEIIFISGWMDKLYLLVAWMARGKGKKVILGLDNHWVGSFRQRILRLILPSLRDRMFSHAFVPGSKQAQFAKKIGFPETRIIIGAYTADTDLFYKVQNHYDNQTILFVGRLTKVKGIELLIDSFLRIVEKPVFSNWRLKIIGDGELRKLLPDRKCISYLGFLSQAEILNVANSVSFFCLPSLNEPWGLVVHEMAAAGLPMLLSTECGSAEDFLVEGYNGYSFNPDVEGELQTRLEQMMKLETAQLKSMGERSRKLSFKNSPSIWCQKLLHGLHN